MASTARILFSRSKLNGQVARWHTELPHVVPHYAVKANNDPKVLRWLATAGVRFDCASIPEMYAVRRAGARPRTDIIYAQPCKRPDEIAAAARLGVTNTVVDSVEEVEKLARGRWRGGTLIRLMVPDAGSAQPFSSKFGAPITWVAEILYALRHYGQRHAGWSFHVGSGCQTPAQYRQALELCATGAAMPGAKTDIVDIGGGFVPDGPSFSLTAAVIRGALGLFSPTTQWIGEPGRFFAAPAAAVEMDVIGRKPFADGRPGWRYTVGESTYGLFSNIPFDGFRPAFTLLAPDAASRPTTRASVFGRTCDSADCLAREVDLPELRVGDRLRVEDMGAYTFVSGTEFNGFKAAHRVYLE